MHSLEGLSTVQKVLFQGLLQVNSGDEEVK